MTEDVEYIDAGEIENLQPKTPEDILGDDCPIEALGHSLEADASQKRHNVFHFLDVKGQVQSFTARTLTSAAVLGMFFGDLAWLTKVAPNLSDTEKELAGDRAQWKMTRVLPLLMRACYVAGFFDPEAVRGPGVWPYGKMEEWPRVDGRIVVHLGDRVSVLTPRDGGGYEWPLAADRAGKRIGEYVYCRAAPETGPADDAMDEADAKRIRNFLGVWNWEDDTKIEGEPLSRFLLLGHLGAQAIPALLHRRPSFFLTGPSGCGKSAVLLLMKGIGAYGVIKLDNASQTGIRKQFVGCNPARSILCNEVESRGGREVERLQEVYDLARYVYSGEGQYVRGGEGLSGLITAIFGFAAIKPPRLEQQDANRMLLLRMGKLRVDAKQVKDFDAALPEIAALGPRLRRRMIERWSDYPATFGRFRQALISVGHEPRTADTFGTLLSCGWLLAFRDMPTEEDCAQWAAHVSCSLLASAMEESAPSWQRCLTDLLTTRIEISKDRARQPVGELVEMVFRDANDHEAIKTLKSFGLSRVLRVGHTEKKTAAAEGRPPKQEPWLAVAYEHQGLDEIFRPTEWRNGAWCSVLPQMPGAERNHPANFGGAKRSKAILVPMDMVIGRDDEMVAYADDPENPPKFTSDPFALKEKAP